MHIRWRWQKSIAVLLNILFLWTTMLPIMRVYVQGVPESGLFDIRGGFMWFVHPSGIMVLLSPVLLTLLLFIQWSSQLKVKLFLIAAVLNVLCGGDAFGACRAWLMEISGSLVEYQFPFMLLNVTMMIISEFAILVYLKAEEKRNWQEDEHISCFEY